jgi:hypothetical protein
MIDEANDSELDGAALRIAAQHLKAALSEAADEGVGRDTLAAVVFTMAFTELAALHGTEAVGRLADDHKAFVPALIEAERMGALN